MAHDFALNELRPIAEEWDKKGEFPKDIILPKAAQAGLPTAGIPEEYGGGGLDPLTSAMVFEELAWGCAGLATSIGANNLALAPIMIAGTEEQKQKWLPPLCDPKNPGLAAFGLTEPEAGSDVANIKTTAKDEGDHWLLNGSKCFITNAGTDITAFVTATAVTGPGDAGNKEISTIMVPNGTPGYTQAPKYKKMGWHGSDTRELAFVDCRVPYENLVGEEGRGFAQFLRTLAGGRIALGALGLGLAQGVYELALQYSRDRFQFGQPIGRFQAIAFKLADMATRIEAARCLLYKAAMLGDLGKDVRKVACMAKLVCSELAVWAADEAVQIHGGYGFMDEYPVSRFYRDAKILTIGEGTSEINRLVISREIGAGAEQ